MGIRTTTKDLRIQARVLGTLVGERLIVCPSPKKGYHLAKTCVGGHYHLTDEQLTVRELEAFMNGAEWVAKNWVIRK